MTCHLTRASDFIFMTAHGEVHEIYYLFPQQRQEHSGQYTGTSRSQHLPLAIVIENREGCSAESPRNEIPCSRATADRQRDAERRTALPTTEAQTRTMFRSKTRDQPPVCCAGGCRVHGNFRSGERQREKMINGKNPRRESAFQKV